MSDKLDNIASLVHTIWADWMQSVFDRSVNYPDGTTIIPAGLATRWKRQIDTPYEDLTNKEQQSDIAIARRILKTIA